MTVTEATAVIDRLRSESNFGLLEMLEIMSDDYQEGGQEGFIKLYSAEERKAFWILAKGFRKLYGWMYR